MNTKEIRDKSNDFQMPPDYALSFSMRLIYFLTKIQGEYGGGCTRLKMKIGVISDTHLYEITREFREIYDKYLSDKDVILHAGDLVSIDVVDFLSKKEFHGVQGNMDPVEVKAMLPTKKIVEIGPYRIGLIHGWGSSSGLEDRIWPEFRDVDVIVYGHSHHAANYIREGVLVFNPGTATGFSSNGIQSIGFFELGDTIRGEIIRV